MNICPYCQHKNDLGVSQCKNCNKKMYSEPRTEWGSRIDEVTRGYRQPPAMGIPHGVQKDAIQNGWGARVYAKNKGGWGMSFEMLRDRGGTRYLAINDWGTSGLTGQVFDGPEDIPDQLPPEERLARFENMNFSGSNYGPGLYGRGKLIFQAASESRDVIYDSLTSVASLRHWTA